MKKEIEERAKKLGLPEKVLMKILLVMTQLNEEELKKLDKILDEYEIRGRKIKEKHVKKAIEINEKYIKVIHSLEKEALASYEKEVAREEEEMADALIAEV